MTTRRRIVEQAGCLWTGCHPVLWWNAGAAALFAAILLCPLLCAQWITYPTAGVPRLAHGKPNLLAPAPRTADGKPDLSGVWAWEDNRPCPPEGCPDQKVGQ